MKHLIFALFAALLGACSSPDFMIDARPVPVTTKTPDHFVLPARFAVARTVYGNLQAAGAKEQALWQDLLARSDSIGTFVPLITGDSRNWHRDEADLIKEARLQRFNYLLLIQMEPSTGSAEISLWDVSSGGVMATAQAVTPSGGQNGFWGNQINNPARLKRATLKIATAAIPVVEEILLGVVERQR